MATPESQRSLPFLKRNIARAVNVFSGAWGSPVLGRRNSGVLPTEDGEHPRKRRRLSTPDNTLDKLIAPSTAFESPPGLRIEVLRCQHKDTNIARHSFDAVVSPDATIAARCTVEIASITSERPRARQALSQRCKVVTFKNPSAPHRVARIEFEHPFHFSRYDLCVNRLDDDVFDLADAYEIVVTLQSDGDSQWPPLDRDDLPYLSEGPLDSLPTRLWAFSSTFTNLYGRLKAPLTVTASNGRIESNQQTDYELDVDIQWQSGFAVSQRLAEEYNLHIAAFGAHSPKTNGQAAVSTDAIVDDREEEDGGETTNVEDTPSRALRTRGGEKNYNLKALSDKAHGRKGKRRKTAPSIPGGDGRVKYFLPSEQPLCLDGFRCVACGDFHQSLKHLELHLQSLHSDYEYKLEYTSQGPLFHIFFEPDHPATPSKTFGIKPAVKSFHLESFVGGNHAWRSSRLDSDTKFELSTIQKAKVEFADFAPQVQARKAVAKTSNGPAAATTKKTIIIPQTRHTFFHPVSKQVLKAGQEVPAPVIETDWFKHKHRETLNDLEKLTPAELEYIKEFDDVLREHDISARVYFPRAWVDFVKKRATWLVESKHRMIEFSKHESYLLASELIGDEHLTEAMGYIDEERAKKRKMARTSPDEDEDDVVINQKSPEPPPKMHPIRKSANGCGTCGLPVLTGPGLVICSNKDCSQRLFHAKCLNAPPKTRQAKSKWFCDPCVTANAKEESP